MRSHRFSCLLLFVLVFAFLSSFCQNKGDKTLKLLQIRQKFETINKHTNYQTIKLEDAELILGHATDAGASLTGYYKGDTLKKIVEWVGLSNRVIQNEYYLDGGKLIFVYATEKQYAVNDSLQTLDYSKLVPFFNGRYYFENNRLLNVILSDKHRNASAEKDAKTYLQQVVTNKALLNKKRN